MQYSGKTLEEALENAEKDTGKTKDEFIYEVTEEKHGLMRVKQVKINITGFKEKGRIAVENGCVKYFKGATLPAVIPGNGVKVIVNGNEIIEKTYLNEYDEVVIETDNTEAQRNLEIIVSDDSMKALLNIVYKPRRIYKVIDKKIDYEVVIEAEVISEEYPPKFTKQDIEEKLKESKIKYGIKWENISKAIEGGEVVIAQGLAPKEPVDDIIEYFFKTEEEKKPVEKDGKVDYYNIGEIECVEKGQLLAKRTEGYDGKTGYDVYGNIIQPKKRKTEKILRGSGCEVLDNGSRAIALIKGMPSIVNNRICVYPVHTIDGDVDIKTGNINFDGDVLVKGNVKEGMKIKAGNNITILLDIADAEISAGGNIKIGRNAISSTIRAGEKQLSEGQALDYIKQFDNFIKKLLLTYSELQKTRRIPANISTGHLIKVLLESKLSGFKDKISEGDEFISKNCSGDIADIWKKCIGIYSIIESEGIKEINYLENMERFINEFIITFEAITVPADAFLYYCQNCSVFATNNVEIRGKGCYNTNISALNSVVFTGYPGVFRGGQIYAVNAIKVGEAGSSAGVLTVLKTSRNGVIEANTVYQNTVLCFDDYSYRIEYPSKMLKAYMQKGEIVVEKLKL